MEQAALDPQYPAWAGYCRYPPLGADAAGGAGAGGRTPPLSAAVQSAVLSAAKPPENLLVCDITGYCACCTPYADINRNEAGQVLTASGRWVNIGEAVAVDPDIIPLGSTVTIGGKTYIASDTGVYGYTVDVLMTHEEAHRAGVSRELVRWE